MTAFLGMYGRTARSPLPLLLASKNLVGVRGFLSGHYRHFELHTKHRHLYQGSTTGTSYVGSSLNTTRDLLAEALSRQRRTYHDSRERSYLVPEVVAALERVGAKELMPVQIAALPTIRDGHDIYITGETGSGKTLAYLAPIISELRRQEAEDDFVPKPNRPRALVLAPTVELVTQIANVAKQLTYDIKIRTLGLNHKYSHLSSRLNAGCDIIIGTPDRVQKMRDRKELFLSHVRYIVLDEADELLDTSFLDTCTRIVGVCKPQFDAKVATMLKPEATAEKEQVSDPALLPSRPQRSHRDVSEAAQIIAVGATVKENSYKFLRSTLPGLRLIVDTEGSVNKIPSRVHQKFISVSGPNGKVVSLIDVLTGKKSAAASSRQALVFCNHAKACSFVAQTIAGAMPGTNVGILHGDIPPKIRRRNIEAFDGKGGILVATDVGARGLDFPDVGLVIHYDFPLETGTYLHRVGRTGRAGRTGKSICLVGRKDAAAVHKLRLTLLKDMDNVDLALPGLMSQHHITQIDQGKNPVYKHAYTGASSTTRKPLKRMGRRETQQPTVKFKKRGKSTPPKRKGAVRR
eukprot:m.784345 g.784345  ORF g.784345 m.784345 type:complete len:575 (+) comp23298_c3_seq2:105-1829(+)